MRPSYTHLEYIAYDSTDSGRIAALGTAEEVARVVGVSVDQIVNKKKHVYINGFQVREIRMKN